MNLIHLLTTLLCLGVWPAPGNGQTAAELLAAAKKGDAQSHYDLGKIYLHRQGAALEVKEPEKEAVKWFRSAADKNHAEAQLALGFCYAAGFGIPKASMVEAVKWYKKAADQGNPEAQFKLGMCYEKGLGGIRVNAAAAVELYRKAADQGLAEAQCALGDHEAGLGSEGNYREMARWYLAAAKKGVPAAQFGAARCLLRAQGVDKDLVEGLKWAILAAASGDQVYVDNLKLIKDTYVKDAKLIAEAEARATAFRPD